ncbi:MAG: ferritin-like domain-containing protein [Bacillota bacterium]
MWHLSLFEPSELIQVAVEIEKRGAVFYRQLKEKAVSAQVKELLEVLAAEEEQHQADFLSLGQDFSPAEPPEAYPGEYQDYVRSLVETHLFSDAEALERMMEEVSTEKEILKLAARLEKDTILFFNGMRRVVKPEKHEVIEDLIAQEESHLAKLGMLLKECNK